MWALIPREEQETLINIDYEDRKFTFYTSRKSVARRIERKVGKPTNVDYINGKIAGVTYIRNLFDGDVKKFMSISTTIGTFRKQKENE